jgi:membrane-bound ClpP family serine protease
MVSFLLLFIAGIVGISPPGCGVIGIVALAMLTAGYTLIFHAYGETFDLSQVGIGYYVAWIASIGALLASFWRKGQKAQQAGVNVTIVNQPQALPPPPPP